MAKEGGISRAAFLKGAGRLARAGITIAVYKAVTPYVTTAQSTFKLRDRVEVKKPVSLIHTVGSIHPHEPLSKRLSPVESGFIMDAFYKLLKGGSEEVEIDPADIHATRPFLTEERLSGRSHRHWGRRSELTKNPLVIEDDGEYYAADGHHKTRRAGEEGKKIKARVVHNNNPRVSKRLKKSDKGSVMDLPVHHTEVNSKGEEGFFGLSQEEYWNFVEQGDDPADWPSNNRS